MLFAKWLSVADSCADCFILFLYFISFSSLYPSVLYAHTHTHIAIFQMGPKINFIEYTFLRILHKMENCEVPSTISPLSTS